MPKIRRCLVLSEACPGTLVGGRLKTLFLPNPLSRFIDSIRASNRPPDTARQEICSIAYFLESMLGQRNEDEPPKLLPIYYQRGISRIVS
jgi:hypothetical protein